MLLRRNRTFCLKLQVQRNLLPTGVATGWAESALSLSQVSETCLGVPNRWKSQPLAVAVRL